jgi:uncharacterized protein YabE (DUF348 family)
MNRKIKILAILSLVIVAGVLTARELHKTVAIVIDDQIIPVAFWGFKVSDALVAAGIPVYEGDEVTPPIDNPIHESDTILIKRAFWVVIYADGEPQTLWTTENVPVKLLRTAGVELGPGDELWSNGVLIDVDKPLEGSAAQSLQVRRSTLVTWEEGGKTYTVRSTATTLGEALWDAGVRLYSSDRLTPPPDTPLGNGEIEATLERSQEIFIQTKDKVIRDRVLAKTSGGALAAAGMPLQGLNYSIPGEDEPIPPDGVIQVVQVREEIILEQEPLPFGYETTPSSEVDLDTQRIVQVGEYGILARRVRVVYEDDQEISRAVEDEWTAKQPKPRIVGYGTKITIQTANTPDGPIEYYRAVQAYATSYSPCRIGTAGTCSSRTASGAELKKGVIGVIRSWYNYMKGASVYIPGYGFAIIADVGGGFSDRNWVDLGYSDGDWVGWSSYVTVYFLTPVPGNILYILN